MNIQINENSPQWLNKLNNDGYCVIPNILTTQECDLTITKIWDWLEDLNTGIDRNDKDTWISENWPFSTKGIIQHLRVGHEEFVWDIRTHPNVFNVFKKIWNTDNLIVSFDAINVMKPAEITKYRATKPWFHIDQSNRKEGLHCIQSFVNLETCTTDDACFSCFPKSHNYHKELCDTFKIDTPKDWIKFGNEELQWLAEKGCNRVRVPVPKGGMVIWDSRVVHCNRPSKIPRPVARFRYVIYVCMTPKVWCNEKNMEKRKKAFNDMRMTTHWPHDVTLFPKIPHTYGKELPNYNIRESPPQLDEVGLKLVGF